MTTKNLKADLVIIGGGGAGLAAALAAAEKYNCAGKGGLCGREHGHGP